MVRKIGLILLLAAYAHALVGMERWTLVPAILPPANDSSFLLQAARDKLHDKSLHAPSLELRREAARVFQACGITEPVILLQSESRNMSCTFYCLHVGFFMIVGKWDFRDFVRYALFHECGHIKMDRAALLPQGVYKHPASFYEGRADRYAIERLVAARDFGPILSFFPLFLDETRASECAVPLPPQYPSRMAQLISILATLSRAADEFHFSLDHLPFGDGELSVCDRRVSHQEAQELFNQQLKLLGGRLVSALQSYCH